MNVLGMGAQLQLLQGSYTTIANVVSIGGPGIECDDVNVTNLLSPNAMKAFLAGWGDGTTVDMEANFDPATFATLYGQFRVMSSWKILFSNGSSWGFTGYLKSIKTENPLEEQVTMPFAIKVSGQPTFTQ